MWHGTSSKRTDVITDVIRAQEEVEKTLPGRF